MDPLKFALTGRDHMDMCRQITCRILGSWLKLNPDPFLIAAIHDGGVDGLDMCPSCPREMQIGLAHSSGCIRRLSGVYLFID